MNRLCPTEKTLSEYTSNVISPENRKLVERHLASCAECRKLVIDTYDLLNRFDRWKMLRNIKNFILHNKWGIASAVFLLLSFIHPRYFLQFLVASLITGTKWIIDSKQTKMLIMIHEALKTTDKEKIESIVTQSGRKR
ncbi:MAG: zf-HC2 domain-containing protein [Candidatus Omnitrophica bacterium]|nr:zf-HC2 domain-containing protein [Candidatus Omnitrophota bacterium]